MRFLTWVFIWNIIPFGMVNAAPPIPAEKPLTEKEATDIDDENTINIFTQIAKPPIKPSSKDQSSFDDVIQSVIDIVVSKDNETGIPIPPKLPEFKQVNDDQDTENLSVVNGIPVPVKKPFKVLATGTRTLNDQLRNKQANDDKVVIRYRGNNDDERTAGRSPSTPNMNNSERVYASRIGRLRETKTQSPFKEAKLPKAGNQSMSDPIILFFIEQSTEMEVGQMAILRDDVLKPLNQSSSATITIDGFAIKGSDKDETRRLSLSRALIIRELLIDNRIDASRIDVRAMSDDTPIEPKNRVEITISR
jgi:outer membrane protein OmpA-like peptidoglycan-associated protein